MNKKHAAAVCVAACLFFGGCTAGLPQRSGPAVTLPPALSVFQAPDGDDAREYAEQVSLYLPQRGTGLLAPMQISMPLPPNRHPADGVIRRLLAAKAAEGFDPLADAALSLQPGTQVEITGDVATLSLSASALALSPESLTITAAAITNTLCQWRDIRYVNLLINGVNPGLDGQSRIPTGSLQFVSNENSGAVFDSLRAVKPDESVPFTAVATLYYPAAFGKGILAEARAVRFKSADFSDMTLSLLQALSSEALTLAGVPRAPSLPSLLSSAPAVTEDGTMGRVLHLDFMEGVDEQFVSAGIPRSVMMAGIVTTLTTFLPGISGVHVKIGNETITALAPTGLYETGGLPLRFDDGIMRREHFRYFLLSPCGFYFADASGGLTRIIRPIPWYQKESVRFLWNQLLALPEAGQSERKLISPFPKGTGDADLIGFAREKDTLLVSLSPALREQCAGLSQRMEQQLLYAMVNTFSEIRGVRRVRFFIGQTQPKTLAGHLYLPGEFMRNADMLSE